jgi:hypothetical protein
MYIDEHKVSNKYLYHFKSIARFFPYLSRMVGIIKGSVDAETLPEHPPQACVRFAVVGLGHTDS